MKHAALSSSYVKLQHGYIASVLSPRFPIRGGEVLVLFAQVRSGRIVKQKNRAILSGKAWLHASGRSYDRKAADLSKRALSHRGYMPLREVTAQLLEGVSAGEFDLNRSSRLFFQIAPSATACFRTLLSGAH